MVKKAEQDTAAPLMAAALGAGQANPELQAIIGDVLKKHLKKQQESEAQEEKHRLNKIKMAQELERVEAAQKIQCRHMKTKDESSAGGQRLSSGQLFLTCQRCHEKWHDPAFDGQNPIPRELLDFVNADAIGG